MSRWIALIDEIDKETLEWLKLSAKYVEVNYNSDFLIENLSRLVKTNPHEVGTIYLEMLNANILPIFDEKDIKNIVQSLYELDKKEIADRICNMYMAEGRSFVRPTYEKFQKR